MDERRRRVDRRVSRMLGERVTLARSGSNVQLTITSLCLRLSGQAWHSICSAPRLTANWAVVGLGACIDCRRGTRLTPFSIRVATAGKNHMNEEITYLLPTGIGERCSQTISYLGHAALLRRCELPL